MTYIYRYPMVAATATVALFDQPNDKIVLAKRSKNAALFPSMWSLPGGFIKARYRREDEDFSLKAARISASERLGWPLSDSHEPEYDEGETPEQAAVREIREELGLNLQHHKLKLFAVHGNGTTDPRAHVINCCYWDTLSKYQLANITPGDDIEDYMLFGFAYNDLPELAFNHNDIAAEAIYEYSERYW